MITLKRILVATDFGEASTAAFTYGQELAKQFDATLHVLYVVPNVYLSTFGAESYAAIAPDLQQQVEDDARRRLTELLADTGKNGRRTIPAILISSSPAATIVDYAKAHDIDIIVIGTHGRGGVAHLMLGSVAERVVRFAQCPVLTVRHPEREFVRTEALAAAAQA